MIQNILLLVTRILFVRACSPDGQHIVSGSGDNLVKVWSVSAGKEVTSLVGHTDKVRSVAFSSDGQHIVSGSEDNLVKVWSASARKEDASLAGHAPARYCFVGRLQHGPDGQYIVSGSLDKLVKVWPEGVCVAGWTHVFCFSIAFRFDQF
jgi:WD40 repeat protein